MIRPALSLFFSHGGLTRYVHLPDQRWKCTSYTLTQLKVDLEVTNCSLLPCQNTYSTALLIGEKAAAIIAEDLGVKFA